MSKPTAVNGLNEAIHNIPIATLSVSITTSSISGKFDLPSIDLVDLMESLLSIERVEPLEECSLERLCKSCVTFL